MATGYRPDVKAFLKDGSLETQEEAKNHGLYFCCFNVAPTGVLREIALEAKQIAREIAQRLPTKTHTGMQDAMSG